MVQFKQKKERVPTIRKCKGAKDTNVSKPNMYLLKKAHKGKGLYNIQYMLYEKGMHLIMYAINTNNGFWYFT